MTRPCPVKQRRALIAEGRILVGAILGRPPGSGALRRYAAGALRFQDGAPLDLPALAHRYPGLIRLFEPVGAPQSRFAHRLALALRVAEATPAGAVITHPAASGPLTVVWRLTGLLAIEALLLPLRLVLGRKR